MDDRSYDPRSLRSLLPGVGRKLGLEAAVETGIIWQRWPEIVGPAVAAHAEPTSLRGGILRVRTDSPTWATEIGYLGRQIALKANEVAGREMVTEVRVWTGPGTPPRSVTKPDPDVTDSALGGVSDELKRKDPVTALEAAKAAWKRRFSGWR